MPTSEGISTNEYFKIDMKHPDAGKLAGSLEGEIYWDEQHGYTSHLVQSMRLRVADHYDIVFEGISREGWDRIRRDLEPIDPTNKMAVLRAVAQLPYLTTDRAFINRMLLDRR